MLLAGSIDFLDEWQRIFTTVPPPDRGSGSFKDETRREMREKRWDEGSDS
jgi:hypothetical protein